MRKSSLMLAALALSTIFGGIVSAQAAVCTTGDPIGRTKADPFGSCETTTGGVKCGTGTDVGGVFTLIVLSNTAGNKGVQGCSHSADALPIGGRVGVLVEGDNDISVHADGSDSENSGGASAWQRYDVRPNALAICARRASGGTWWTGSSGGVGTTAPNPNNSGDVNQGLDANGSRTPCGGAPIPA